MREDAELGTHSRCHMLTTLDAKKSLLEDQLIELAKEKSEDVSVAEEPRSFGCKLQESLAQKPVW
jgi:hypothetical protein